MSRRSFQAEIQAGRGGGAYVDIPFDVEQVFGTRGRVPVKATIDGEPYRGSIAPMGGHHRLGVTKAMRAAIERSVGDRVRVTVEADTEPRVVTVPPDLQAALKRVPSLASAFEALSYTHQKEFVVWIEEARKPETRDRRIARTMEMLRDRKTR